MLFRNRRNRGDEPFSASKGRHRDSFFETFVPCIPKRPFRSWPVKTHDNCPYRCFYTAYGFFADHCDYFQTYGLTETSPYLTISKLKASLEHLPESERFWYKACTGRPLIGVELKVVDEQGKPVLEDRKSVGEIIVRGPSVSPGYYRNQQQTDAAFRDGWFYTGDLAVRDKEGYVNIVDRKKDVIMTGGEQVFSIEVENILMEHPAVLEVAVVAVPDEKWGETVKAVVVKHGDMDLTAEELMAFCRSRIAHYKAPKSVDFLDSLPRTGSNKINKREIRDRYWGSHNRRVN